MFEQSHLLLPHTRIRHGFFGREGGVSAGIYDTLNCGPSSADRLDNVIENRWRAIHALGLEETKLFGLQQVHSTTVHVITPKSTDDFHQGDALVTRTRGYALSVLGADCAPVLFADAKAQVIGAAHAGWRGAVTGIVEAVVSNMCDLGAQRDAIQACIGPCIHPDSYQVQDDFIQQLNELSSFDPSPFVITKQGDHFFDLPNYLLKQCEHSSIDAHSLGIDTYKNADTYFSYRRNTHEKQTDYGRQISIIALP